MKARILLITILIYHFITLITCKPNVVINEKTCDTWFPEPISKQAPQQYPYLKERFRLVDAFLYDVEYKDWIEYSKDYVLRSLNGEVLGGFEVMKMMLRNVPSIRKVFMSTLCILLAKIIFFIVWKIALIHEFHTVGTYLNFQKHRYGLTFIPIVCILSLLILNSHFNTVTEIAINGLENLETADDKNFMPIKERIENILAPLTCRFKTTWKANRTQRGYSDDVREYFKYTVNGTYHGDVNPYSQQTNSTICDKFQNDIGDQFHAIENLDNGYPDLPRMVNVMEQNYMNMTSENLSKALKVFAKALGSIEEFVERYHSDVLQLPTESAIRGYYSAVVTVTGVTVAVTCLFVTLSVMMVQMRKKWIVYLTYSGVFLMMCCAVVVAVLFLAILIKTSFILLTENTSLSNNFEVFNASKPTVFDEHGYKYTVNYGEFLAKTTKVNSTWFSLVKNHNEYHGHDTEVPIALNGHRLWKLQGEFNETFQEYLKVAIGYQDYQKRSCETMTSLYQKVEKLASETKCQEKDLVKAQLEYTKTKRDDRCLPNYVNPFPSNETIFQRSEEYWKKNLIQHHSYGIIHRSSARNPRGLMQVYLVFINPEMKLRPNVLEPWFGMAVLMFAMSPFIFLITIYMMCITPLLISDIEQSEEEEVTARSKSLSISNSNSKE